MMQWKYIDGLAEYLPTVTQMEETVARIHAQEAPEQIWLLEHPPLFTAGTSANHADLSRQAPYPVHQTGRGGQYTYHGPGQRVAYVMLDLRQRGQDVRAFVALLETWIMRSLARFDVESFTREGRTGVWVHDRSGKEAKIAAIGIRLRKWVSFHGISVNIHPNLADFRHIVPCGLQEYGVTSLAALHKDITLNTWDRACIEEGEALFSLGQH